MKSPTSLRAIPVFLAAALCVFSACSPDDDEPVPPASGGTPTGGVPSGDHAVFTMDGTTITVLASGTNILSVFSSAAQSGGIYQENQGTTVASTGGIPQHPLSWARVKEIDVSMSPTNTPSEAEIEALYQVQSYPFGKSINEVGAANAMDGVVVNYFDTVTNVSWSSDKGTGDQTGSSFAIVSRTPLSEPGLFGQYNVRVEFACKLYDDNGNVKTLTNCSMRGKAGRFY